jgi:hypothetical protein
MSELKVINDKEKVVKEALRKKYQKEIADQLTKKARVCKPLFLQRNYDDE